MLVIPVNSRGMSDSKLAYVAGLCSKLNTCMLLHARTQLLQGA